MDAKRKIVGVNPLAADRGRKNLITYKWCKPIIHVTDLLILHACSRDTACYL